MYIFVTHCVVGIFLSPIVLQIYFVTHCVACIFLSPIVLQVYFCHPLCYRYILSPIVLHVYFVTHCVACIFCHPLCCMYILSPIVLQGYFVTHCVAGIFLSPIVLQVYFCHPSSLWLFLYYFSFSDAYSSSLSSFGRKHTSQLLKNQSSCFSQSTHISENGIGMIKLVYFYFGIAVYCTFHKRRKVTAISNDWQHFHDVNFINNCSKSVSSEFSVLCLCFQWVKQSLYSAFVFIYNVKNNYCTVILKN